jgi:hypothetical protein
MGEPPALGEAITEFRGCLSRFGNRAKSLERWCDDEGAKATIVAARQRVAEIESLIAEVARRGRKVSTLEPEPTLTDARAACDIAATWIVGELKKPTKSALQPRIEFKPRSTGSIKCDFELLLMIDNDGNAPVSDYKLEVTIPRRFVSSYQSPFLDEASSTGETALFRRPQPGEASPPAIYVGRNTDPVIHFRYELKPKDFADDALETVVRAIVHRPDGGKAEVSMLLAELHDCTYRNGTLTKDNNVIGD